MLNEEGLKPEKTIDTAKIVGHITNAICNIAIVLIIIGFIIGAIWVVKQLTFKEVTNGRLEEVDNGVYAQTYSVYSNVPANNTSVAIVCINNKLCKISGKINIYYTNDAPHYEYTSTHRVNGDKLDIYVPKGTVQRLDNKMCTD